MELSTNRLFGVLSRVEVPQKLLSDATAIKTYVQKSSAFDGSQNFFLEPFLLFRALETYVQTTHNIEADRMMKSVSLTLPEHSRLTESLKIPSSALLISSAHVALIARCILRLQQHTKEPLFSSQMLRFEHFRRKSFDTFFAIISKNAQRSTENRNCQREPERIEKVPNEIGFYRHLPGAVKPIASTRATSFYDLDSGQIIIKNDFSKTHQRKSTPQRQ